MDDVTPIAFDDFQIAVERARRRFGERTWTELLIHEQASAIYEALRAVDAECIGRRHR